MTSRSVDNKFNVLAALVALALTLSGSFMLVGIRILTAFTDNFV